MRQLMFSINSLASSQNDKAELSLAYQKVGVASFHLGLYAEAKAAFLKAQQVTGIFSFYCLSFFFLIYSSFYLYGECLYVVAISLRELLHSGHVCVLY